MQTIRNFLIGVLSLAISMLASAAPVTMNANDTSGASSLLAPGQWSNAAAPVATNDYFSSTFFIRTPAGTTNFTFAGNSLTLQAPSTASQGTPIRSILFKGAAGNITIINNLTNSGGVINAGSGNVLAVFGGNQMCVVSNSTIMADQGPFQINYPLAGTADLTNTSGQGRTITYTGTNSAYTGRFVVTANVIVAFNSVSNVPGNPVSPEPDQFLIGDGCTLLDNAGFNYNNANGGITLAGPTVTINASATNALGQTIPTTIAVPITDNGSNYLLVKRGASILTLSASNSFGGGLNLQTLTAGSQLNINHPNALGTGTFDIAGGAVAPAILDNSSGSAITVAGNNSQVWSNNFVFIGSSSLNLGSGTVTLGTNITATVSNNNLTVGLIADGGLGYALSKSGPGTLTLNGGGTYTGTTTISNGVLALTGSGLLSSTNISIGTNGTLDVTALGSLTLAAGQVLGGKGTVAGSLADGSGTQIFPGGINSAGTLTVNGNLTLNGAGSMVFDLVSQSTPGGGTNDLIVVGGTLNIAGPTAVNISGLVGGGTYTLIKYGAFSGSLANLSVPAGYTLANNTGARTIELTPTHTPVSLIWHGDGSANVWDVATTLNWLSSGTNQYFYQGDTVTFDNSGFNSPSINLSGTISPTATTVNANLNYDFTGSGITSGTLTKSGSGTLILENNNAYPGVTVINGGTLQVGNGGTAGAVGTGALTNNATLVFNRADAAAVANNIGGTGIVTLTGSGDVSLSGSNSYSGLTIIASTATLHPKNASALGLASAGLINTNGGRLYADVNVDFPNEPLILGGGGSAAIALEKGGSGVSTFGGAVTLVSDLTLSVDGNSTLNLTNAAGVNGANANANLILAGAGTGNFAGAAALGSGNVTVNGGTWTVAPANSYSGLTTINGGALLMTGPLSLSQPPAAFNASQVTINGGALGAAANVTLNDGKIGITLNASATLAVVNTNTTLTISNDIGGSASITLTKTGPGTLVLNGANDFAGTLNVDSGSTTTNDGTTVIANSAAIANILAIQGIPFINIRNNNGGSSTLGLDGTLGSVVIPQDISLAGRNVAVQSIENLAGNNTISGSFTLAVGGNFYQIQSDSGTLDLTAPALPYATPTSSGRTFTFQGSGNITVDSIIQDGSNNGTSNVWDNVVKTGTGLLSLPAANIYSGTTVVSNGVLSLTGSLGAGGATVAGGLFVGTGMIAGPVIVSAPGTIETGTTNGIGTLNFSSTLALTGNTIVKIDKSPVANDVFSGQTAVTYGGVLLVTNLGGTLTTSDHFTLFNPGASASNFASIIGSPGAGLAYSFTNGVLSVVPGPAGNPTNILVSVSGNTLTLSWPADHLGWILQSQTNSAAKGLATNWVDVAGSASVTGATLIINAANPAVFYRLRQP